MTRHLSWGPFNTIYPMRPLAGGGAEIGVVTKTSVNLLAFGSIPATATVTVRVPRENGKVVPLIAHVCQTAPFGPRPGCDPSFSPPTATTLVEGTVEVFISDLVLDGVPVDVGPSCRTMEPTPVYLWGAQGENPYFPSSGGELGAYDGINPGSRFAVDHPIYRGRFDGRENIPASTGIDIPSFTGCGTAGEDLSSLVTSVAAGPNNPIRAIQKTPVEFPADEGVPIDDLLRCDINGNCPLPAPPVPAAPPLPWE